jgi:polar amino acid transport system substrate-binding protein
MLFSLPYLIAAQHLVVRSEQTEVSSIHDLSGGEVGAEIGTTGSRFVRSVPNVAVRTYDDLGLGVEDLLNARIEGIVADTAIIEYFVLNNPNTQGRLRIVGEPYAIEEYAYPVRKDRPDLRDRISRELSTIVTDGTWLRLYRKWFPSSASGFTTVEEIPAFPAKTFRGQ